MDVGRLVVTRKKGEKLFIGDDIAVTVVEADGGKARLLIEAPRRVQIVREELRVREDAARQE